MSALEVDWSQPTFWISCASIVFNPLAWNIIARNEYRTHSMTKMMGSALRGCYLLAFLIFTFGLLRDWLFTVAMDNQPIAKNLDTLPIKALGVLFLGVGNLLVVSSMWKLGVTGTYLGDYFGILMEERVTGFPFNTMENPMYNGSTLSFLGTALWRASPAGILISGLVYIVYHVAVTYFEGPFTGMIYSNRDKARRKTK